LVEFFVFSKDPLGGGVELFVAMSEEIGYCGARQLTGSDSQSVSLLP